MKLETAGFHRQPFEHKTIKCYDGLFYDDTYAFNPQQGSQWDGLRHFSQADLGQRAKERRRECSMVARQEQRLRIVRTCAWHAALG